MDPDEPLADPEFLALARRVRLAAEDELAEIEDETERARVKQQDLTARSMQAMMEGERWQVLIGGRTIDAIVVHVGQNFTGLQDRSGNLHDVTHAALGRIRVLGTDPTQGRAPVTLRPATFLARLLDLEERRQVELVGHGAAWSIHGELASVNRDHVVVSEAGGGMSIIPLEAIAYVGRAAEPPGRVRRLRPRP